MTICCRCGNHSDLGLCVYQQTLSREAVTNNGEVATSGAAISDQLIGFPASQPNGKNNGGTSTEGHWNLVMAAAGCLRIGIVKFDCAVATGGLVVCL